MHDTLFLLHEPAMSILRVQRQTIKTILDNGKPVALILLMTILTIPQLETAVRCSLDELAYRFSHHRSYPRDMHELLVVKLLLLMCSCCVILLFEVATVSFDIKLMLIPSKLVRYVFKN